MASGLKKVGLVVAAAALAALGAGQASPASDAPLDAYRVIVNPANPVRQLSRSFLRDAFLKKATSWDDGVAIRPLDLPRHHPARQRFTREVLNKTPAQLRAYWSQLIFSGKAVPPPQLDSDAAVIAHVLRHRGAVGYLPASSDPRGAATVTLR